jgi:hypothetical protein
MSLTQTDPTRTQRARNSYHSYQFTATNIRLRSEAGPVNLGVVYVKNAKGACYTVRLNGFCQPIHCDCPDHARRGLACKHMTMVDMFLTGEVPPLPAPEFDIDAEGALLARLEESERIERARRESALWD